MRFEVSTTTGFVFTAKARAIQEALKGPASEQLSLPAGGESVFSYFVRDENGRRAVFGENELFQHDPQWRDYVPFHEYFHGDTGEGLGAGHQTGWTALVALLIQHRGQLCFDKAPVGTSSETHEGKVA